MASYSKCNGGKKKSDSCREPKAYDKFRSRMWRYWLEEIDMVIYKIQRRKVFSIVDYIGSCLQGITSIDKVGHFMVKCKQTSP